MSAPKYKPGTLIWCVEFGMGYTLAFAPFAVPGIILLVIGLIQRVI